MKKMFLLLSILLGGLTMVACNKTSTPTPTEEPKQEEAIIVKDIEKIDIEIGETYTLKHIINSNKGLTVSSEEKVVYEFKDNVLTGLSKGESTLIFQKDNKYQNVTVKVHDKGELSTTFSFDVGRLSGKKIVAFGDSVTANATLGGGNTYFDTFAAAYQMNKGKNYAIGGTTATYTYEGSNIYKEYGNNPTVLDGVRVVKNAYDKAQLNDVDYVFIAYGHNDQYFQPPITVEGDNVYDVNSFDSCHSFKGSYRYMINTLKLANPNVRIILLNCTYSEYDRTNPSRYGKTYNYNDYRNAITEIAEEFNLTCIDPWDYLYPFFDAYEGKHYYKDSVHLSAQGHIELARYICDYREQ